jgi:hypothetical protein
MRMRHSERFGVMIVGRHRTLTVVRVAPPETEWRYRPALLEQAESVAAAYDAVSVDPVVREDHDRVAIPVESDGMPEIIALPGGGTFTWLPSPRSA